MTDQVIEQFTIHGITGLDTGDRWGIPDTPQQVGVMRSTAATTGQRVTMIIDYGQAEMLTTATDYLEGTIEANPSVIRWMRLGWPTEWETSFEPNAWMRCADGNLLAVQDGDEA